MGTFWNIWKLNKQANNNMVMKHNRKNSISAWLSVLALLLTTACADHADLYLSQAGNESSNIVEITVQPPVSSLMTRTDGEDSHISDGSKVDVLIYALYEKQDDGKYIIMENPEIKGVETSNSDENTPKGHIRIKLSKDGYPYKIQPKLDSKKEYKMVFWAQSEECKAYNTSNLEKVKVDYKDAKNNDELRDAFCTSIKINSNNNRYVAILRRPFAQINVGTTGWDYEGAAVLKPSQVSYTKSLITLNGVAQYYNVLEEKAIVEENGEKALTTVTFSYNRLPAFIHLSEEDVNNLSSYEPVNNEEFLKVHLYDDNKTGKYLEYKGWNVYKDYSNNLDTDDATKALQTETYKYLSMCYALVPEASSEEGEEGDADNISNGAVLTSVTFEAKGLEYKEPEKEEYDSEVSASDVDDNGSGEGESKADAGIGKVFEISNVPVKKNWRTNILGNNFFTQATKYKIDIVPDYMGDYNFNSDGDKNVWPGEGGETYYVSFNNDGKNCNEGSADIPEGSKDIFSFREDDGHGKQHDHFDCICDANAQLSDSEKKKRENRFRIATYTGTLLQGDLPSQFDHCLMAGRKTRIRFQIDNPSTVYILQSKGIEYKSDTGDPYPGYLTLIPDDGDDMENFKKYYQDDEEYKLKDEEAITEGCSGCRLHVIKDLPAGSYIIKTGGWYENNNKDATWHDGGGQCGIYYIEVQTPRVVDDETKFPNEDLDPDIKNDYDGKSNGSDQGE